MKEVTLTALIPSEGKVLHKIGTDTYCPDSLYLGILDKAENYEEVDVAVYEAWLKEQEERMAEQAEGEAPSE